MTVGSEIVTLGGEDVGAQELRLIDKSWVFLELDIQSLLGRWRF
jgi:hypothetical protein